MEPTAFTERFGCRVPVQLAPMGALCTVGLMAAVTGAGGMAMASLPLMPPPVAEKTIATTDEAVPGPWGVNFLVPLVDRDVVAMAGERVRYVDFYHGAPDVSLLDLARTGGALVGWQVCSLDDAQAAFDLGVDLLVVRGTEGGGRMDGERSLWPLLFEVLDAVGDAVPVLAAGGIATGRGLAAAVAAGAAGARLGTRFVATVESGAHDAYKAAVVAAGPGETVLTDAFNVLWPAPGSAARVLRSAVEAARALDDDVAGEVLVAGERRRLPKQAVVPPAADATGHVEAMALYAGETAGAITSVEPAAAVLERIVGEADGLLRW